VDCNECEHNEVPDEDNSWRMVVDFVVSDEEGEGCDREAYVDA
jgi:hypothetical protein